MIVSGISLFNESILVDQGFQKEVYYNSLALGTAVGVASNLVAGWLGLHWPINRLLAVSLFMLSGSMLWLTKIINLPGRGWLRSGERRRWWDFDRHVFSVWPVLYGRTHLGRIQGIAQMMTVLASAVGPILFAQSKTMTGSYQPLLYVLAVFLFCTAGVAWLTPLPHRNPQPSGVS